jgi:hypothetical protein
MADERGIGEQKNRLGYEGAERGYCQSPDVAIKRRMQHTHCLLLSGTR